MDSETDATQTVVGSIEPAAPRAKRPRKEADKRRARVQDLHNKYADIDFSRYQDTHADQYPPTLSMAEDASAAQGNSGAACGRIVPVKPVPTATVQHWRLWESYERNGDKSFSETEFALLCEQEGHLCSRLIFRFSCHNATNFFEGVYKVQYVLQGRGCAGAVRPARPSKLYAAR